MARRLRSDASLCQTVHVLSPNLERTRLHGQAQPEEELLRRIAVDPTICGGKPIIRGRRLVAGDTAETIGQGYPWLEREDIQACLIYARRLVGRERVKPALGQD